MREYTLKTLFTDLLILLEIGVIVTITVLLATIFTVLRAIPAGLAEHTVNLAGKVF